MKKIFLSITSILTLEANAQVIIGSGAATNSEPKNYTGLEVRSNNKQGLQLPIVAIKDVTSDTHPINKPLTGTIIYNLDAPTQQGIYFWNQKENNGRGMWVQMADASNVISNMFMNTTGSFSVLENEPVGKFVSLLNENFKVVGNEISASFSTDPKTGGITLQPNSGYTIYLALDIVADDEHNMQGKGIGNSDLFKHSYTIQLQDLEGNIYAHPANVSATSVAGKGNNQHSIYATFAFPLTLEPVTLFPYIAYESDNGQNGGNYYLNQPAGNTGKITIKSAKIHIDRGLLAL